MPCLEHCQPKNYFNFKIHESDTSVLCYWEARGSLTSVRWVCGRGPSEAPFDADVTAQGPRPLQEAEATWGVTRWGQNSSCLSFLMAAKGTPTRTGEHCHTVTAYRTAGLECLWGGVKTESHAGIEQKYTSTPAICTYIGWQGESLRVAGGRSLVSYNMGMAVSTAGGCRNWQKGVWTSLLPWKE